MQHMFSVEVATQYGLVEAILLQNLYYWIEHNRANERNYHNDTYWTYNSIKAFRTLFPYLSERKIYTALKKLQELGIIETGNFNENSHDRTLWYSITKMGYCILQNDKMENVILQNGNCQNVKCTYYTNNKPNNKPYSKRVQAAENETLEVDLQSKYFLKFWEAYPNKVKKPIAKIEWNKLPIDESLYQSIIESVERYKKTKQWKDVSFVPYPENYLQDERWTDEINLAESKVSISSAYEEAMQGYGVS